MVERVPRDGNRSVWGVRTQRALEALARRAVHGAAGDATTADAVFFESQEEALALFLRAALGSHALDAWYWPLVAGVDETSSRAERIATAFERLRELPGSWVRVARVLFAGDRSALEAAASALDPGRVGLWLREFGDDAPAGGAAPPRLELTIAQTVAAIVERYGTRDVRSLFVAALAMLDHAPATLAAGTVVGIARSTLLTVVADARNASHAEASRTNDGEWARRELPEDGRHDVRTAARDRSAFDGRTPPAVAAAHEPADRARAVAEPLRAEAPDRNRSVGLASRFAGLAFLLNPLARLDIARAIEREPEIARVALAARVLERLGRTCGVAADDPLLVWLENELERSAGAFAALVPGPGAWPKGFSAPRRAACDGEVLVRVWCLAVRRWCRRAGRLTIADVVQRFGRIAIAPTDLDISFKLEDGDIRIRRVALDVDPGWLPWFGLAVRFHYIDTAR